MYTFSRRVSQLAGISGFNIGPRAVKVHVVCVRFIYLIVQCDPYYRFVNSLAEEYKKAEPTCVNHFPRKTGFYVDGNFRFPTIISSF